MLTTRKQLYIAVMVLVAIALAAIVALIGQAVDTAHDHPVEERRQKIPATAPLHIKGDDNGDKVIDEDESGWDCHTMGNRVCG